MKEIVLGNKVNQMVCLGSANVDFFSYVKKLPGRGETIVGSKFIQSYGGKGANTVVAYAKLGGKTYFVAKVGDDHWGAAYINRLNECLVDTSFIQIVKNINTGIAQICVEESGENNIVITPGANDKLGVDDITYAEQIFKTSKLLMLQLECPIKTVEKAIEQFSGISILNASPVVEGLDQKLLKMPTIVCVNESEVSSITHLQVNNPEEGKSAGHKMLEMGCKSVIVTLGGQGAIYGCQENPAFIHIKAPEVNVIDTTGAGDAFLGALGYMLVHFSHISMEKSLEVACHLASLSVEKEGIQEIYPTEKDLRDVLNKHNIDISTKLD